METKFKDLIKKNIDDKGITIKSLVEKTHIKYDSLVRIFSGEQKLTVENYYVICKALGLNPNELYEEWKNANSRPF